MKNKDSIADNLRNLSAEEVAAAIKAGKTTLYELSKSGNLTPMKKRQIQDILDGKVAPQPAAPAYSGVEPAWPGVADNKIDDYIETPSAPQPASAPAEPTFAAATNQEETDFHNENTSFVEETFSQEPEPVV